MVIAQYTTESIATHDSPDNATGGLIWPDDGMVDSLVRAFVVIVQHELRDRTSEVSLTERHDLVKATGFDGENESLGMGVQIWRSGRLADWCHSTFNKHAAKGFGV